MSSGPEVDLLFGRTPYIVLLTLVILLDVLSLALILILFQEGILEKCKT